MESKVELELRWENEVCLTLTAKEDDGESKTILKMEENSCITKLLPHAKSLIVTYMSQLMDMVIKDMKE